ncbi:MAG: type II toxin-antitoxin system VapC family toxin [Caldilineaceae bacterium]|jgi:PIN domain nuclease of toxin-antitoxin system
MRFLIDTHVFLWFINGDNRLSQSVRKAIEGEENEVLLSIASVWEIAIKTNVGKLGLAKPFAELIPEQIIENEIELTPISMDDLKVVALLPLHHRDPFDRLLIAQALVQEIAIASDDSSFKQYGVKLFW